MIGSSNEAPVVESLELPRSLKSPKSIPKEAAVTLDYPEDEATLTSPPYIKSPKPKQRVSSPTRDIIASPEPTEIEADDVSSLLYLFSLTIN
jgi:hypothetical protein